MGLDVALCVVILIAAIRGWLQGFVYQAVRLGGLVACVYVADPVRDQAKPHLLPYLPTIRPDLLDRILWWVAAGLSYVVLVGAVTLVLKMTKRPEIPGVPLQRSRNDQFAGFLLGIAKGLVVAAFLTGGLQKYALKQVETITWARDQVTSSWALRWDNQYHPAERVWTSPPVQHLVNHIQRMGLKSPANSLPADPEGSSPEHPVVQTASRTAEDGANPPSPIDDSESAPPAPPEQAAPKPRLADPELEKAVEDLKAALDASSRPK
jgi:uncharacterized membrane protein required for colicin V production